MRASRRNFSSFGARRKHNHRESKKEQGLMLVLLRPRSLSLFSTILGGPGSSGGKRPPGSKGSSAVLGLGQLRLPWGRGSTPGGSRQFSPASGRKASPDAALVGSARLRFDSKESRFVCVFGQSCGNFLPPSPAGALLNESAAFRRAVAEFSARP